MGTTVATNALLERKGERCALLITKGFKVEITSSELDIRSLLTRFSTEHMLVSCFVRSIVSTSI